MFFHRHHLAMALLLSACVTGVASHWGARSVGGADSAGYVSQADAWLSGQVYVRDPFIEAHHPPFSRWALAPLGWRPEVDGYAIVPSYSPGYPLMLAGAKWLGGQGAMFAVVPLFAGLLVFVTYALGRRLDRPRAGLLAAAFVATSPSVLFMAIMPMSDVPSAALWSAALVLALGERRRTALAAGLVTAMAILVRPNLVPIAFLIAVWLLARDVSALGVRQINRWRAPWFVVTAAIGAVINGKINAWLFGSPWKSGYGDLDQIFGWRHVLPNLRHYASFLITAETALAMIALLVAVLAPVFMRWNPRARQAAWLLAPAVLGVIGIYLLYMEFDVWWYLRFMLPIWPMLAMSGACLVAAAWQRRHWAMRAGAALVAFIVIAHGVAFAVQEHVLTIGLTESRYSQVARAVTNLTEPSAAIISMQHSGSVSYYAGRVIVRWTYLDGDRFDDAVQWLIDHEHQPYLLLDAFEVKEIRERFGRQSEIAKLDWTPRYTFFHGETFLYDLADRGRQLHTTEAGAYSDRTARPVPRRPW